MRSPGARWLLLTVLACTPAPVPPEPPAAPVLEGDGALVFHFQWTLKGTAPPETVVRLHLDDACRGPALRDFTSAELGEGVSLDLVSGTPNVFTAVAIDAQGLSSACSAPVRVRYERPARPRRPEATITPPPPTRETRFVIRGTAEGATSVQLFEDFNCIGSPIGELGVDAFREVGFTVEVPPNVGRVFVLRALNQVGDVSACSSTLSAFSDHFPPVVQLAILSPRPSPERSALIGLSSDAALGTVFLGPDCAGSVLSSCSGSDCTAFPVEFPMAPSSSWSATAVDGLGNSAGCVNALDSWEWDPLAPAPLIELTSNQQPLKGLVPASCAWVELFDGPACDPAHLRAFVAGVRLAGPGVFTGSFNVPSDGGVLVARGLSLDQQTAYPCSQPVPWF